MEASGGKPMSTNGDLYKKDFYTSTMSRCGATEPPAAKQAASLACPW
jgi:hypothetical protein